MQKPKAYRDRAARALSRAQDVKAPELRVTFETLAEGYEALARGAERLGGDTAGHVEWQSMEPSNVRTI
jgi:hypothetical protein